MRKVRNESVQHKCNPRRWRECWAWDGATLVATHCSGWAVKFTVDADEYWDCEIVATPKLPCAFPPKNLYDNAVEIFVSNTTDSSNGRASQCESVPGSTPGSVVSNANVTGLAPRKDDK